MAEIVDSTGTATTHYIHTDHLGTPRAMTDQSAAVVWDIETTPFGEVVTQTGTAALNLRFPGQYADSESGLSYNYYRDYDPSVGRYVQSDPIGLAGGLNTYGYVLGNPVRYSDPSGLWVPQAIGALVNAGFEGYNQYQNGKFDPGRLAVAAATGALGGFGSTALRAIGFGVASGAINSWYRQLDEASCKSDFDVSQLLMDSTFSGLGGLMGFGVGAFGKNIYRPVDVIGVDPAFMVTNNYGNIGSAIGAAGGTAFGNQ